MQQQIVMYVHNEQKLFYYGVYNFNSKLKNSASVKTNYSRAAYLLKQMTDGLTPQGLRSGFMMALINTGFSGWESHELSDVYGDAITADDAKRTLIEGFEYNNPDWTYVGSPKKHIKGAAREFGLSDSSWNKSWNASKMTKEKIREKIEFIVKSINEPIPERIYVDAYLCIAIDGEMKRRHNFPSFEINNLVALFRYVRNYLGKDING